MRSLVYEGTGFKVMGNRLWLSEIGDLRIVLSCPISGVIKQIVLKFTQTHKWFVSVISKTLTDPTGRDTVRLVGIDLNHVAFSHDSDNAVVPYPHNLKKSLRYKAERASIVFKEVDPTYTSQTCSSCGHRQSMPLNVRIFACPTCGYSINRDLNAARNILARAFSVGWGSPEFTPAKVETAIPCSAKEHVTTHDAGISRL